jgi:hypothetical protein
MEDASRLKAREWTVEDLRPLDRDGLMAVFTQLPAPRPEAMAGEFASSLPDYSDAEWRSAMAALGKDYWLGKSYSPQEYNGHRGHGLNSYRRGDGSIRRLSRFVWDIGPSVVDGRPSLVMRYAAFGNWGGMHDLIDEIRVAGDGVFVGLYHTQTPVPGFTPRQGNGRSGIEFFILAGPVGPFVPADED